MVVDVLYSNDGYFEGDDPDGLGYLSYLGRFELDGTSIVLATGFRQKESARKGEWAYEYETLVFQIDGGGCELRYGWPFEMTRPTSLVFDENYAYLGGNRVVSRVNLSDGHVAFYTNKSEDDLKALRPVWR